MAVLSVAVAAPVSKPQACLGGAAPRKAHYRRSTTTKAPRKRTFIASMSKYNTSDIPASSAASGEARAALAAAIVCTNFGGDDTGAGAGGNGGRVSRGPSGGGSDGFNGRNPSPRSFASLLPGAVGLAAALLTASMFAPFESSSSGSSSNLAVASSLVPLELAVAASTAAAGRRVTAAGVSSATASAAAMLERSAARAAAAAAEPIVYGRIALSADERLLLCSCVREIRV